MCNVLLTSLYGPSAEFRKRIDKRTQSTWRLENTFSSFCPSCPLFVLHVHSNPSTLAMCIAQTCFVVPEFSCDHTTPGVGGLTILSCTGRLCRKVHRLQYNERVGTFKRVSKIHLKLKDVLKLFAKFWQKLQHKYGASATLIKKVKNASNLRKALWKHLLRRLQRIICFCICRSVTMWGTKDTSFVWKHLIEL